MRWAEITVRCAPEATEAVSYAFVEAGCGGVMMRGDDPVIVQASLPVADELSGKLADLKAHFARLPEFGLPALIEGLTLRYAEDEDWATAWKQYFKPAKLGQRLVVKPSWEEYTPADDEVVLELDPGMAFGTGGHPTTRLCLLALEERVAPGITVADIGTGSGILSLAAAKLGASAVWATDIDPLPRKIAHENVVRNGLEGRIQILELADFEARARNCDLIVANIVARTIIELAPSVAARLKPDGIFIAAGIVEDYHDAVLEALREAGFTVEDTKRDDIWVCLVSRHTGANPDGDAYARVANSLLSTVGNEWA
jgi:ribosomal protein L11 methyltransferase